jgi:hypothetical protein
LAGIAIEGGQAVQAFEEEGVRESLADADIVAKADEVFQDAEGFANPTEDLVGFEAIERAHGTLELLLHIGPKDGEVLRVSGIGDEAARASQGGLVGGGITTVLEGVGVAGLTAAFTPGNEGGFSHVCSVFSLFVAQMFCEFKGRKAISPINPPSRP